MNFWAKKKVTITGGAGFIGSHLAQNLVYEGAYLKIVDNLERGKIEYIRPFLDDIEFIKGDVRILDTCYEICSGADIVIHLASKVGGIGYYLQKPGEVITQNVTMDTNMVKAVLKKKVSKYFYASSAHVYPIQLQQRPNSDAIKEDQVLPANPELSYGWAKLFAEKQLEYLIKERGLSTKFAIARFIGIYGQNQDIGLDTGSVIPVFCRRAVEFPSNKPFIIWGTGKETRSYCFIDDAIDCIKRMIIKLDSESLVGPLNVGKEETNSIIELAEKIIHISGKRINIEFDDSKKTLIWGQWCDCSKARQELDGWHASTPLKIGLKHVYDNVKKRIKE
jgi:nucleoside-diphosphate-sugar epimerase